MTDSLAIVGMVTGGYRSDTSRVSYTERGNFGTTVYRYETFDVASSVYYCESYADWHRLTEQVRGKEVVLQGATRTVDAQGQVTTSGGKAAPNPLLPVIDRAHRSLQVALEELLRPAPWALAPTPAPVADGTQAEPAHPWLRHPDETAKAYAAFRYYRDLGEQRAAIRKYAQKFTSQRASSSAGRRSTPG